MIGFFNTVIQFCYSIILVEHCSPYRLVPTNGRKSQPVLDHLIDILHPIFSVSLSSTFFGQFGTLFGN
jgi:hypothetical protein